MLLAYHDMPNLELFLPWVKFFIYVIGFVISLVMFVNRDPDLYIHFTVGACMQEKMFCDVKPQISPFFFLFNLNMYQI